MSELIIASILAIMLFLWGAFVVMIFLQYIFSSIAIFRIMKKQSIAYPFLSWIPIVRCYELVSIHDSIKRENHLFNICDLSGLPSSDTRSLPKRYMFVYVSNFRLASIANLGLSVGSCSNCQHSIHRSLFDQSECYF